MASSAACAVMRLASPAMWGTSLHEWRAMAARHSHTRSPQSHHVHISVAERTMSDVNDTYSLAARSGAAIMRIGCAGTGETRLQQ